MKLLTAVISIVGVACCAALLAYSANRASPTNLNTALLTDPEFITHLAKFSKSYASMDEYSLRAGIFRENLEKIRQLNLDHNDTVTFDVNHMADWTAEEYQGLEDHLCRSILTFRLMAGLTCLKSLITLLIPRITLTCPILLHRTHTQLTGGLKPL